MEKKVRFTLRVTALTATFALSAAIPGLATPGDGNGNGPPPAPPGQAKSESAPPGQAKTESDQTGQAKTESHQTGRGANTAGPYDPSGVGQPSGNGNSTSNNGQRPCAGCVGKADAKNPPGQLPGGGDANRGYECDENQGVGKTNPAHSGCTSTTSTPPNGDTPPRRDNPDGGDTPPRGDTSGSGNPPAGTSSPDGAVLGDRASGLASDDASSPAQPSEGSSSPTGAEPRLKSAARLPFTGLDLIGIALVGGLALLAGAAVRRRVGALGL